MYVHTVVALFLAPVHMGLHSTIIAKVFGTMGRFILHFFGIDFSDFNVFFSVRSGLNCKQHAAKIVAQLS